MQELIDSTAIQGLLMFLAVLSIKYGYHIRKSEEQERE